MLPRYAVSIGDRRRLCVYFLMFVCILCQWVPIQQWQHTLSPLEIWYWTGPGGSVTSDIIVIMSSIMINSWDNGSFWIKMVSVRSTVHEDSPGIQPNHPVEKWLTVWVSFEFSKRQQVVCPDHEDPLWPCLLPCHYHSVCVWLAGGDFQMAGKLHRTIRGQWIAGWRLNQAKEFHLATRDEVGCVGTWSSIGVCPDVGVHQVVGY